MKEHAPINNLMQTATIMVFMTLISKVIGFCRELVLAGAYGTGYVMDAYVLAQTIPTVLLGGILAAVSTSYIPIYSKIKETRGPQAGDGYTNSIINLIVCLAGIVYVVGVLFSDQIVVVFSQNLSAEAANLTGLFLKVTFSYAIFSCALTTMTSYLQYNGKFYAPIIGGYFYNLGVVVVVVISAKTDVRLLPFGVLIGNILHLLTVYAAARRTGYHHSFRISSAYNSDLKQALRLAVPVFFNSSLYNLNSFVDKTLASTLQEGSIAALNYGTTLVTVISGLTVTIIMTILYPKLAQAINQEDKALYRGMVRNISSILLLISVPIAFGIIAFSQQVVQIIYERGSFDGASTALTGEAFLFYGAGFVFVAMNDLLSRVYYAMRDMKTPVICAAISISVNIGMNLLLIGPMAHRGLALSTTIAAGVNTIAMTLCLRKKECELKVFPPVQKVIRIVLASGISVAAAAGVYQLLFSIWMPRMVQLGLAVLTAGLVYLPLLKILKIEEVDLLRTLFQRGKDERQS